MSPDDTASPHMTDSFHLFLHYKRCSGLVLNFPIHRCYISLTWRQEYIYTASFSRSLWQGESM